MDGGLWREEAAFPSLGRAGHAVCGVGARLYLLGGRINHKLCSDVQVYDSVARRWEEVCPGSEALQRSYHSATLVGDEVWVCGGADIESVSGDVLVFSPASAAFRRPRLRGALALLRRTAHGACVHPLRPHCLLLFGGYGGQLDSATQEYEYLFDLVEIDTRAGTVKALEPSGPPPEPRAYTTFTAVGQFCYCVGGRTHANRLCKGRQLVQVYDCAANRWVTPGVVAGDLAPRSSHRAVGVPGGLLVFGGAVDRGNRSAELALLSVAAGRLAWRHIAPGGGSQAAGNTWPLARGAHAADVVGGRLYVCGGYGQDKQYTGDMWSLSLQAAGVQDPGAASPVQQLPSAQQQQQQQQQPLPLPQQQNGGARPAAPAATEWREARRSGRAAGLGSEPQPHQKRQRVAGPGRRGAAAVAAVVAVAPDAPPSPLDSAASGRAHAAPPQPPPPPQQQQQQGGGEAAPGSTQQRLREVEDSLRRLQLVTAGAQQQVAALQQENAGLREQVDHWRKAAMQQQEASRAATEAMLQQTREELSTARDQLAAARREKEDAVARLEADAFDLRTTLQRERGDKERELLERARAISALQAELQQARDQAQAMRDAQARQQRQLEEAQAARDELERQLSAARTDHGTERAALQAAEREAKDAAEALRADNASLQARLESERAAAADARHELERQLEQCRLQRERAEREQDAAAAAQRQASDLRLRLQQAEAAQASQRMLLGPLDTALSALNDAFQRLKGGGGGGGGR